MKKLKPNPKADIPTSLLLSQGDSYFYIDVEELANRTTIDGADDGDEMLHFQKFETYKALIEVILSPVDPIAKDDVLGLTKKTPPSFDFKLAFNTLIIDKIIKTYE